MNECLLYVKFECLLRMNEYTGSDFYMHFIVLWFKKTDLGIAVLPSFDAYII